MSLLNGLIDGLINRLIDGLIGRFLDGFREKQMVGRTN